MVVTTDLQITGTKTVESFLSDFSDFHYKAYEDVTEREEIVHWGLVNIKSTTGKTTFYVHYEDWSALYCYLLMLYDEYDVKTVKFESKNC